MTVDLLRTYPDLVTELDRAAGRRCPVPARSGYGSAGQCWRSARWRVRGYPAMCGQHAAQTLRRELQDRTEAAGGS